MDADGLAWLMGWYVDQCDSNWEHSYGVKIDTLDNPGWRLTIDLRETSLQTKSFHRVTHGLGAADLEEWRQTGSWWVADVRDGCFEAYCGPLDLPTIIGVFRSWATA